MGRRAKSKRLYCYMNGVLIGYLVNRSGQLSFQYDSTWLSHPQSRPISLSLPLQSAEHKGNNVDAYFDNLLPDNIQIRQEIVNRLEAESTLTFDLLNAVGVDCVGALSLTNTPNTTGQTKIKLEPLTDDKIASVLR